MNTTPKTTGCELGVPIVEQDTPLRTPSNRDVDQLLEQTPPTGFEIPPGEQVGRELGDLVQMNAQHARDVEAVRLASAEVIAPALRAAFSTGAPVPTDIGEQYVAAIRSHRSK